MNCTKRRELTRGADHWFENGNDAMNHRNWDYALECFEQAIRIEPNELEYRKQKHRSSRRRLGSSRQISSVGKVKLGAIRSRLLTAQMKNDWLSIDKLAEEGNSVNPWDAEFFALIARAAKHLGNLKIARYAWTSAVKIDENNSTYYREFGAILQQLGEYEMAKSCFQKIEGIDPSGRVSKELIAAVDIASVIDLGGYTNARSTRDVRVDEPIDVFPDEMSNEDDPIIIEHDPYLDLVEAVTIGEEHVRCGRLCSAIESYRQAIEAAPTNSAVLHRKEDIELSYLRQQALAAQENAKCNPHAEARSAAALRLRELTDRELEIRTSRVEQDPNNPQHAFQLADLYRRTTKFRLAVPLFETAMTVDELRAEALIGLGECLIHIEKASVGHRHLMTALTMIAVEHKPNAFKLAHYWLARLYEAQQYVQQAVAHYAMITTVDRNFRDVNNRLKRLEV